MVTTIYYSFVFVPIIPTSLLTCFIFSRLVWKEHAMEAKAWEINCIWQVLLALVSTACLLQSNHENMKQAFSKENFPWNEASRKILCKN